MSFTLVKNLEPFPSYAILCELAEHNHVRVTGDEHTGSFSGRGVEGDYKFSADGLRGRFAGHRITGEFSFETDKVTVTVIEKPFWLPERVLKQKILEGLDSLANSLERVEVPRG